VSERTYQGGYHPGDRLMWSDEGLYIWRTVGATEADRFTVDDRSGPGVYSTEQDDWWIPLVERHDAFPGGGTGDNPKRWTNACYVQPASDDLDVLAARRVGVAELADIAGAKAEVQA